MHPFFSVTLFTGQQLVLEALQRWLARPCPDAVSQARRRLGVKQLISLLLRTAATGVLATVLDAAIEFRRRQLLAAAAVEPSDESGAGSAAPTSLFPGLGMLSRAGVAAWKSRLLLAIDELERRAGDFGIESRHRFSPAKAVAEPAELVSAGKPLRHPAAGSCIDLAGTGAEPECSQHLGRTVEQLRELVQQKDPESQRHLDAEVGSLVDLILGACPSAPATPSGTRPGAAGSAACSAAAAAAGRCCSVPSALDGLWAEGTGAAEDLCAICMDRPVTVQVAGCSHDLCFSCARRLCASHDHLVPQCPFCRQAIEGFVARPLPSLGRPAAAPAVRA